MIQQNVTAAEKRIKEHVVQTPFERSAMLSDLTGADVWLKMENQQHTGSFKFRGAMNKTVSYTHLTLPTILLV